MEQKTVAGSRKPAAGGKRHRPLAPLLVLILAFPLPGTGRTALDIPSTVKALDSTSPYLTWVDLDAKTLTVTDRAGKVLWSVPCGIGRGNAAGNPEKKSDFDRITPTGVFRINHVFPLGHPEMEKMNAIDWPDLYKTGRRIGTRAYGDGFVAFDWTKPLDRPAPASGANVRGQFRRSKEQNGSLFSLGIHGTNRDDWVGLASTGGCVRLFNPDIRTYIERYAREGGLIVIR
jgi:hypothetical protein